MGAGPNFSSYSAVPNDHERSNSLNSMDVPEKAAAAWDPTSSGGAAPTGHMPLLTHDPDAAPQRSNTFDGRAPQSPSQYAPEPPRSNTLR